jgi:hypothetical protein
MASLTIILKIATGWIAVLVRREAVLLQEGATGW